VHYLQEMGYLQDAEACALAPAGNEGLQEVGVESFDRRENAAAAAAARAWGSQAQGLGARASISRQ